MARRRNPNGYENKSLTPHIGTAWILPAVTHLREKFAPGEEFRMMGDLPTELGQSPETQEVRLRELTRRGFLHMASKFDEQGKWLGYAWSLKDAS